MAIGGADGNEIPAYRNFYFYGDRSVKRAGDQTALCMAVLGSLR